MNKIWKDDVYVIEGIDSTTQLAEFYKEVVDKNIEKYVGITSQGRCFKFDPTIGKSGKAVLLLENEKFGINPNYRKVEQVKEVPAEPVKVEKVKAEPEKKVVEEKKCKCAEKDVTIAQLTESIKKKDKEMNLLIERADNAEKEWHIASERVRTLNTELENVKKAAANKPAPVSKDSKIDNLIAEFKALGYEVFIKKI